MIHMNFTHESEFTGSGTYTGMEAGFTASGQEGTFGGEGNVLRQGCDDGLH